MSAFAAIAYDDRVEVIADGATLDAQNRLAYVGEKVFVSSHVPLAFAARGRTGACRILWWELERLSRCGSFDKTIEAFQAYLQTGTEAMRKRKLGLDAVIAGFSEKAGPILGYFTSQEDQDVYEPWQIVNPGPLCSGGPEPSAEALAQFGFPERMQQDRLSDCGADLMEAVRSTPVNRDGAEVFGVGGQVDCAIVDANGARLHRLRDWPDKIGEKIQP